MADKFPKNAKRCCSREHDRLVKRLSTCDNDFETPSERHRCYRVAAKLSGRSTKKCMSDE